MPPRNRPLVFFLSLLVFSLGFLPARALAEEKVSKLEVIVVRAANGKPVRNASVVLHPVGKNGRQAKGGLELKTDPEGKASM